MKPIAYYSKSRDYVCTLEERTRLKLYKKYPVPLIVAPKPLNKNEIYDLIINKVSDYELCRAIEERHGIK